jgi:hypothetical protein
MVIPYHPCLAGPVQQALRALNHDPALIAHFRSAFGVRPHIRASYRNGAKNLRLKLGQIERSEVGQAMAEQCVL